MRKLLIDTSIIIDFLRRTDKEKSLLYQLSHDDLCISIITHTELYSGKSVWEHNAAKEELETLFSGLSIFPLIPDISQVAGRIKANYHNSSLFDCIIAATALYHRLELATLNSKDFEPFEGLTLFRT
jgi:tRNA(fMet)-specific endonuclease VapC